MGASSRPDVTALLHSWRTGDDEALARLTPLVYDELHRLAHGYMRGERAGHPLQTTALVHEAYIRLVGSRRVDWQNRAHFLAVAAQLMRRVLVDVVRRQRVQKRGGDWQRISFADDLELPARDRTDVVAVDEALQELARLDRRKARVVELRFFGGLSLEETAEALDVSVDTVGRERRAAKAWLTRELQR